MKRKIIFTLISGTLFVLIATLILSRIDPDKKACDALAAKITSDVSRLHNDSKNTTFDARECIMSVEKTDELGTTIQLVALAAIEKYEGDEAKKQAKFTTEQGRVKLRRLEAGELKSFDGSMFLLNLDSGAYESGAATRIANDIQALASICLKKKKAAEPGQKEITARIAAAKKYTPVAQTASATIQTAQTPAPPANFNPAVDTQAPANVEKALAKLFKKGQKAENKPKDILSCAKKYFWENIETEKITHNDFVMITGTACFGSIELMLKTTQKDQYLEVGKARTITRDSKKFNAISLQGKACNEYSSDYDLTGRMPIIKPGDFLIPAEEDKKQVILVTKYDSSTGKASVIYYDYAKKESKSTDKAKFIREIDGKLIGYPLMLMSTNKKICE